MIFSKKVFHYYFYVFWLEVKTKRLYIVKVFSTEGVSKFGQCPKVNVYFVILICPLRSMQFLHNSDIIILKEAFNQKTQ